MKNPIAVKSLESLTLVRNHRRMAAPGKALNSACQKMARVLLLACAWAVSENSLFPAELESDIGLPKSDTSTSANVEKKANDIEKSVVKIFATVRYPDLFKPWTTQSPMEITGSGVVIEGKRILSNAHVVLYGSQIEVQASESGERIPATIEAVAPGIDLAVLKLESESFFGAHPPLARAKVLPGIREVVMAYGFPQGGTSLSITKGIVSRIEFAPYNLGVGGLRIQIDASINPGNSGGPVVADNKMIGLAFSHLRGAQNVGYVIPCEEIELFLQDLAAGGYKGKPAMYDQLQTLENPALRSFLKLSSSVEGILVHRPASNDPAYPLKEWDLITEIGGRPVDNLGMVRLGTNFRVSLRYFVQKMASSGKVPLTVIRCGKEMRVELPVSADHPTLISGLNGLYPSYFVCGPLVFSSPTIEMVEGLAEGKAGAGRLLRLAALGHPLLRRLADQPSVPGESLVIISSPFFPHKITKGYDDPMLQVVKSVNGIRVKSLEHLVKVLRDSSDPFLTFECDNVGGETMVFPRNELLGATEGVLTDNGIRTQASPDMLAVWNARASGSKEVAQVSR